MRSESRIELASPLLWQAGHEMLVKQLGYCAGRSDVRKISVQSGQTHVTDLPVLGQ